MKAGTATALSEPLLPLNVRIPVALSRELTVLVARLGITKQAALEQALTMWIAQQNAPLVRTMTDAPLIPSDRPGSLDLTNQQIDDLLFS
jgi:hypothetical protein